VVLPGALMGQAVRAEPGWAGQDAVEVMADGARVVGKDKRNTTVALRLSVRAP
jgi:hypothetical protein